MRRGARGSVKRPGGRPANGDVCAGTAFRLGSGPLGDSYDSIPPPPAYPLPPHEGMSGGRGRRVIVIGGGRGGVGKTLLTVNLGVYFAQLGREVVVCDADPFGSNLHSVLGLDSPPLASTTAMDEGTAELVATTVPGLRILPTAYDPMTATPARPSRGASFLKT